MTDKGAMLEGVTATFGAAFGAVDPAFALIGGIAIGICMALGFRQWPITPRRQADPLSGLFARETLDSQLAQIADPEAVSERRDREASAFRAKMFARRSVTAPEVAEVPPHRADRYDHAAVLAHVAKVMRAGTDLGKDVPVNADAGQGSEAGDWEEVLLLPPPSTSAPEEEAAQAA